MSKENPWQDPEFAQQYATDAADPNRGWYEHEINYPSIASLIPEGSEKILDFGCGPGDFTAKLAQSYAVEGCDNSASMLDIARRAYPDVNFFEWDFQQEHSHDRTDYDAVVAKLVVQFIQDLGRFALTISDVLRPGGSFIVSVPHPIQTAKQVQDYWLESEYRQQISKYGIYDMMIHRSLEQYVEIFTEAGYVLTGLSEPRVGASQLQKHNANQDDFLLPKRINMRWQKRT